MKYNSKQYLASIGMKEKLIQKLTKSQAEQLADFAMERHIDPSLLTTLICLASLELRGKVGAIFLVSKEIVTLRHIRSLNSSQILQIIDFFDNPDNDEYENHKNARIMANQFITQNQELKFEKEHIQNNTISHQNYTRV